ncbi:hypothetical protein BO71DRAFT_336454 [Aspergillus ellipticus CBS 707.79]|uniref:Zn(2)-C6 fungal-type domain-containing protein n=1 Tax=Aspergillus ellipticus CBS 707.79 TaxID=1448320 RepID=A0A319CWB8_9EURO|nr:hypothetical protein BO71DRAFT_336454 [Aspergillus ellipticus CBS 707.79]
MKRRAPQPSNASKRVSRQDPVSCDSCRAKKIKCDRQQPCTSCVARRLTCIYDRPGPAATSIVDQTVRVRPRPPTGPPPSRNARESQLTADWLENIHMADLVATATPKWLRDGLSDPDHDAASPRGVVSRPYLNRSAMGENPATIKLVSFLPTKAETLDLVRYYHRYVHYMYHILVPQRIEEHINGIYRCMDTAAPVDLNHLALIFSILASALYMQLSLQSSADAEACSREFSYLTGAALIQGHYPASPTLEGFQATMVVLHNLSNWNIPPSVSTLFTIGALELKRRLWWDLTTLDWLLGFLTGPQEWTYHLHLDQMNVKKPSNIDDIAIETHPGVSLPSSTPTDMSFTLERLKLASVCREVVDAISYEQLHGLDISYDKILALDRKFHQIQAEIPAFFRLDPASRRRFAALYEERPTIAWQGCLLQQGHFSRLCRLHRDFFIRGARDPAYSYSHIICLQSARKVLEIKRIMDGGEPHHTPPNSVVWSVMHHVFMAAVILLLDVCFNWDDILAEKRREEVLEACRMMNKAQESSSLVREGIAAMMAVLRKHWKSGKQQDDAHPADPGVADTGVLPGTADPATTALSGYPADRTALNKQFEDIWAEFLDTGNNLAMETPDWRDLLNELTEPSLSYG